MESTHWFIIYIILLLSSPISKIFSSGNINGKYSKKDYNYLLKLCKEQFKNKFKLVNNDDVMNNRKEIKKCFDNEKYKIFLLRIKNFIIGFIIGFIISEYSFFNNKLSKEEQTKEKEKNERNKAIEKSIRSFLSIILLGIYPIFILYNITKKEKNTIEFTQSNYFVEIFEIVCGIIFGYIMFYFLNKNNKKANQFYKIKYDNITYITIFILLSLLSTYSGYMFFKPS